MLAKAVRMRAEVLAIRMSQASASDMPAPAATPFHMAMVGLGISCSRREHSMRLRSSSTPSSKLRIGRWPAARAFMSPPAEKPRPAPVSTMQPISGSAAAASSATCRSRIMVRPRAFSTSGRFMVSTSTPPSRS